LANTLAHENTVLLQTTMGAVAVTEQAIIIEAHERGMVVPNRKERFTDEDTQAAGAYVAYPKKGIHDWIGSIDINSLYPSAIRALNMGPETIVGQLRPTMTDRLIQDKIAGGDSFAAAWEGLFASLEYTAVMEQVRKLFTQLLRFGKCCLILINRGFSVPMALYSPMKKKV
jgi:DNA polymerase elongation subunit (family B)